MHQKYLVACGQESNRAARVSDERVAVQPTTITTRDHTIIAIKPNVGKK